jgi:hypothetical protein
VTIGEALAILNRLASLVERLAFGTPEQTAARDLAIEAEKLFNREVLDLDGYSVAELMRREAMAIHAAHQNCHDPDERKAWERIAQEYAEARRGRTRWMPLPESPESRP